MPEAILKAESPTFKTERAGQDFQLWSQWKKTRSSGDLSNLLDAIEPIIFRATSSRRGSGLPENALRTHAKVLAVKAFESYDPRRGVQLNTHLTSQLQKVSRLVYNYQDLTHIPEHTQLKIGTFKTSKALLGDKLGRQPTAQELSEDLRWSMKDVDRMERSLRKVLVSSGEGDLSSQATEAPDRQAEVLHLIYGDLRPEEKLVMEAVSGFGGKEPLKGDKTIGGRLGMEPGAVKKIRDQIAGKIKRYTEGESSE